MSAPHPPSSPNAGPSEPVEPPWNPGGRNLSYINRTGRRKLGVVGVLLSIHPVPAPVDYCHYFALGTWQIYRLKWKKGLIERYSENLQQDPIILPADIGNHTVEELDHRTVLIRGKFRHDQEMLVGPRIRDGVLGYHIITPIERDNGKPVLVNRGWIAQMFAQRATRPASVVPNTTIIKGLGILVSECDLMEVRAPPGGNVFTPRNDFAHGKFYSVNVKEMADWTGSQPLLIEQTFDGGLLDAEKMAEQGLPIGRYPGITLRNAHFQYSLAIVTTGMCYFLFRKPRATYAERVLSQRAFGAETPRGMKGWS